MPSDIDAQIDRQITAKRVKWESGAKPQFIDKLDNGAIDRLDEQVTHLLHSHTTVDLNDYVM